MDCKYAKGVSASLHLRLRGKGRPFKPAEGLLDVEVDAEEQERPEDDGEQR